MHQCPNNLLLTSELLKTIEECYQKAELFFNQSFKRPEVKLDLKGYNAGTATPQKNLLRFNKQLLIENKNDFLKKTVPHEVAHLIAYQIFGLKIKPHGKEWQRIMQQTYQLPAERCHNFKIKKKPTNYYIYLCNCNFNHQLTIRRHNAIQKGVKYICKSCKNTLIYSKNIIQI